MIEAFILFIKGFPHWLYITLEVLVVAVLFSFCAIFMWGVITGIRIIRWRAEYISEITLFPPNIKFRQKDE